MTDQETLNTLILGLQSQIESLSKKLDATKNPPADTPKAEGEPAPPPSVHTRAPEADGLDPTKQSDQDREKYLRERGLL